MTNPKLNTVNTTITDDIKKMLRLKGHYDLGALEQSINEFIEDDNGTYRLTAKALEYIEELEYGVDASKIDESKIDVTKLAGWVGRKITTTNPEAVAYAIIKKWKKVGKPTDPSGLLSVEQTFQENQNRYNDMIDDAVIGDIDSEFLTIKSGTI